MEDSVIRVYHAVETGKELPKFRRIFLPPSEESSVPRRRACLAVHQSTWRHVCEDLKLCQNCCENIKSRKLKRYC